MNTTYAEIVVFRFDTDNGSIHPAYFQDYKIPDPDDPELHELVAEPNDLLEDVTMWICQQSWYVGVNWDESHEYVRVEVDADWKNLEHIEQEILLRFLHEPNYELAMERFCRRMQARIDKNKFNPAYGVLLDGLNKMMGC